MEQVQPVKPVEPVKKIDWGWIRNYLKSLNLSLDEMERFQLMLEKVPPVVSGKRRRDTVMTQEKRFNLIVIALFHRWKNASIRGLSLSFGLSERTARRFMNNTRVVDNHFYFPLRDIERQTKRVPKKVECVLVSQVPVGMVVSPVPVGTVVSPVQVGMVISPVQVPVVLGRLISVRLNAQAEHLQDEHLITVWFSKSRYVLDHHLKQLTLCLLRKHCYHCVCEEMVFYYNIQNVI